VFAEVRRILRPGGFLILEIPNKSHAKARLQNLIPGNDRKAYRTAEAINISSNRKDMFLNHNPRTILRDLAAEGFTVLETLSVSNLRSSSLKRRLPFTMLIALERTLQTLLSRFWFGPSIYFLAKLERQKI
jgi:SAM-dependent methyltransferase